MGMLDDYSALGLSERVALKKMSTTDFMSFMRVWFRILQGDKLLVNWHHRVFMDLVDDIIYRRIPNRNVVINCPPGSTKTEVYSIHFPAYVNALVNVGKLKRFRNLNLSFSDDLVQRNSIRTRDIIASDEYQSIFPCSLGINQAKEWTIVDERGKRIAETVSRSVGGQITGSRAGYIGPEYSGHLMLDDPDKISDQLSDLKRKRQHDFMTGTIRSRRGDKSKDNATPIICIAQRTHIDDTSGFLLAGGMGVKFDHIKIPALVTENYIQSLPDRYRDLCWNDVKDTESVVVAGERYWSFWAANEDIGQLMDLWDADEYSFTSQYLQEPIALSGRIFDSSWIGYYGDEENPTPPYFEYRFITADTATKTGTRNDFSVFSHFGVYQGRLYMIDMCRGKFEAPELEATFRAFIGDAWGMNSNMANGNLRAVLVEDASSGTGLIQTVGRASPIPITPVKRNKDKLTRALDCAPQVKAGKLLVPAGKDWVVHVVSELALFSADDSHKHDDAADTVFDGINYALINNTSLFDMIYR